MVTRDDWAIYDGLPPVSNIHCYKDRSGYFAIEADFGGSDYVNLAYDTEDNRYSIEDPYLGLVHYSDDLNTATGFFCQFYKLSPEDCQLIADKKQELGSGEYIASATESDEDFDVFMLIDYSADTGPDTMGMEGDTFDCLGKFFATDLETAKKELDSILEQHPELKEVCPGLYVSEYIESFDSPAREEQDEYENPYDVDNNVFGDLQALVDYCFDWDYINNLAQGEADDEELPFSMEDTFSPEDDNFALYAISNTIDSISLDPDYSETIEDIRWTSDPDSGVFTIKLYFWDGGYNLIEIDPAELESQTDYNQASKLVRDKVDAAINEYGG